MKKMGFITSALLVTGACLTGYMLLNKDTNKKANKIINDMLDEADNMITKKHN